MNRQRGWRAVVRSEDGIGLMMVIAVGALVMLMAIGAQMLASVSLTSSRQHQEYQEAIDASEQGVDETYGRLKENWSYSTDTLVADTYGATAAAAGDIGSLPSTTTTVAAEKAWLLGRAEWVRQNQPGLIKHSTEGDYLALRPSNRRTVYTISWIPNATAPKRTRLIKAEFLLAASNPKQAVLIDGRLVVSGNAVVSGVGGNVHANDIVNIGGSANISGDLSSTGAILDNGGGFSVGGQTKPNAPAVQVDDLNPRTVWDQNRGKINPATGAWEPNPLWYDLCAGGVVKAAPTTAATGPCTGPVTTATGWSFSGPATGPGGTWSYNSSTGYPGTYYAYQSSIDIAGSPGSSSDPWSATLLSESLPDPSGRLYGDITLTGHPSISGSLTNIAILAGRDLRIQGSPSPATTETFEGLLGAREQIHVSGDTTLFGVLMANDLPDTSGSPVSATEISGNMSITFDGNLEVLVGQRIRTALWLEL